MRDLISKILTKETAAVAVRVLEYKRKNNMKKLTLHFVMSLIVCGFITNAIAQGKQKPGVTYDAVITRVVDGDTVAFQANFLPDPLKKELSVRVFGVDTPEKGHRALCPSEAARGEAASAFTKAQINASTKRQVILMDWDKYGGRVLGDILLDGKSLRQMLIQNGYAREYYGEAKQSWCN
jgi:endonuclease YncB( thermonuclease family)